MEIKMTHFSCLFFAGLVLAVNVWASDELVVRHQGIPHDALYDVCFRGEQGVAVGAFGILLTSSDGGYSWSSSETLKSKSALLGAECLSDKVIVVGQEGAIHIKTNGEWQEVETPTQERLFAVEMTDDGLGIAVGGFGTVLRTLDGGANWETMSIDWETILNDFVEPHVYDVNISATGVITIVGEFALVIQSRDKGETWTIQNKGDASLFALNLNQSGTGFAAGQTGTVIKTTDGGASWKTVDIGGEGIFLDVWSSSKGEVIVIGIREMLRSNDYGVSWASVTAGDIETSWYQSIGVAAVSELNEENGTNLTLLQEKVYVVGHSGRVIEVR